MLGLIQIGRLFHSLSLSSFILIKDVAEINSLNVKKNNKPYSI